MPEGPEVENIVNTLKRKLFNKKIKKVDIYYANVITGYEDNILDNQYILDIIRLGKYIIFKLTKNVLVSHLRMEGRFYIKDNEPKLKHEHFRLTFTDNKTLRFIDTRKFGRIEIKDYNNYLNTPPLVNLAKEPKDMNIEDFYNKLQKKRTNIKTALLDQRFILSIGNIYADEILFKSKIDPLRKTNNITKKEANEILINSVEILDEATKLGGSTIYTFEISENNKGTYQNKLKVHLRENKPCLVCGNNIEKIKVGGRGTYVCKNCQK